MSQKIEIIGDNQSELLAFCRFLVRVDDWTAEQILALLESPHRWQAEFSFWQENKEAMENGELTNGD